MQKPWPCLFLHNCNIVIAEVSSPVYISVLEYIPYGDMFTLWTFHGFFPERLVRIYVAELAMVLGKQFYKM